MPWCCGSRKLQHESEDEAPAPVDINRRQSSVKHHQYLQRHTSEKYSIDEKSVPNSSAMKLVPVGSSDSNSAFRAGGMNFAVERDQSKIWSSPQGQATAKLGGMLVLHEGCREPLRGPTLDIVAVHGLNSDAIHAWTFEGKTMWLEDLLPEQLPNARIMTYGYNSKVYRDATSGRLQDHAKGLLYALDSVRADKKARKRPIIFLCHSLGGLVTKQALVISQLDDTYADIRKSTYGIVFLATPHRGSSSANLANVVSNIAMAAFPGIQTQLLKTLEKDSNTLGDLTDNFRHLAKDFQIASFYELKPTSLTGDRLSGPMQTQIVIQSSAVMDIPGERQVPMNADHRRIARFSGADDPLYVDVSTRLREMASEAPVIIHVRSLSLRGNSPKPLSLAGDMVSKLRAWLNPASDLDHERTSLRNKRCAKTGDWIFLNQQYLSWREQAESGLLWLHARPGAGKSVLAAHLIENFEVSGRPFGYFFFKYNNENLSSPQTLLRSICFQLCLKHTAIYESIFKLMESGYDAQKQRIGSLWQQLFKDRILQIKTSEPIFWVVDGLDECVEEDRSSLLQLFADLQACTLHVKMIVLSRRTKDIHATMNNLPFKVYEICPEDNHEDIMTYAQHRLSGSTINSQENLKETVLDQIEKQHSGTFLWVQTALDQVIQQDTVDGILESLSTLPREMDAYYLRILKSITQNEQTTSSLKLSRAIFDWTVVAARPLYLQELSAPLTAEFGSLIDIKTSIANHCGGLVSTDSADRVEAIHMTVVEYLQQPSSEHAFSINLTTANARAAIFCFQTLTSVTLLTIDVGEAVNEEFLIQYQFIQYAVEFAFRHLGTAQSSLDLSSKVKMFLTSSYLLIWIKLLGHLSLLDSLAPALSNLEAYIGRETTGSALFDSTITGVLTKIRYLIATFGYPTSEHYVGDLVDGKRHGYGTSETLDGGSQTGNWVNDKPEGFSIASYLSGSKYVGDWKENEWHGKGHYIDPEGNVYKGDYNIGKKHGFGIMKWTWGSRHTYTGQWLHERCHGLGEMTYANGDVYYGAWKNGLMHGRGKFIKWNDDVYEGDFIEGIAGGTFSRAAESTDTPATSEGMGDVTIHFKSGTTYTGDVANGRPHGQGTLRSKTGLVWIGQFKDGMMDGDGVGTWPNGGYSKGTWKEGVADGRFVEVNDCPERQCRFEGIYKLGIREGEGEMWQPVGYHYKGNFHADEIHGYGVRNRHIRGRYDGHFLNGLEHGQATHHMPGKSTYIGFWQMRKKHDENALLTFKDGSVYKGAWVGGLSRKGEFLFKEGVGKLEDIIDFDEQGKIGPHRKL